MESGRNGSSKNQEIGMLESIAISKLHGGVTNWDRTYTLLFIINMLFDINPTHDPNICNAILAMPVPAHKSLWQATSYAEWKKAHTEFLQKREGRPSLTYRDMVELHQKSQTSQKHTLGDLDDWFLNLDAFGTFVLMTAASIWYCSDGEWGKLHRPDLIYPFRLFEFSLSLNVYVIARKG